MSRLERTNDKARRLLAEGRVQVQQATVDHVQARVAGDHAVYAVEWDHGAWKCSCPAYARCSHREAVRLVTMAPVSRGLIRSERNP